MARTLTKLKFRSLFTIQEKAAMTQAAKNDPIIEAFMYDLSIAEVIDLDYPDVAAGLDYAVAQGLLTQARADEILATPIEEAPPIYTVTIKAMDVITAENVSGAIQREDGKWSVRAEFVNSANQQYNLEMEFNGCPTHEEVYARIGQEAKALQVMI